MEARPHFTIRGRQVTITADDVLKATFRRDPEEVVPGTHWVLIRRKRVPAKWALRLTLAHLAAEGREGAVALRGPDFQTAQAVNIMRRLGFPTGQQPRA